MGKRIVFILAVAVQLLILSLYWYEIDLHHLIFGQAIKNTASPKLKPRTSTKKHDNIVNSMQYKKRGKLKLGKDLLLHLSSKNDRSRTRVNDKATDSSDKPLQTEVTTFAGNNGIKTRLKALNNVQMNKDIVTSKVKNLENSLDLFHKTENDVFKKVLQNIKSQDSLPTALPATFAAKLHTIDDHVSFIHDKRSTESDKQESPNFPLQREAIEQLISYDRENGKNVMMVPEAHGTQKVKPTSLNVIRKTRAYHTEKGAVTVRIQNRKMKIYFTKRSNLASQNRRIVTEAYRTEEIESLTSLTPIRRTRAHHTEKVVPVVRNTVREEMADRTEKVSPTSPAFIRRTRAHHTHELSSISEITAGEGTAARSQEVNRTSLTSSMKTRAHHTEHASTGSKLTTREKPTDRRQEVSPSSLTSVGETRAYHTKKVTPISNTTTREKTADRSQRVNPTSFTVVEQTRAYHTEKVAPVSVVTTKEKTADRSQKVNPTSLTSIKKTRTEKVAPVSEITTREKTADRSQKVNPTSFTLVEEIRAYHTEKVAPVSEITTTEKTADRTQKVNPTSLTSIKKIRTHHTEKLTPVSEITGREETADHIRTREVYSTLSTLSRKTKAYNTEKLTPVSQIVTKEPSDFPTKKVSAIIPQATTKAEATMHEKSTLHLKNNRFRSDPNMLFGDEYEKAREIRTVDLLIIVLTAPSNAKRRKSIRQTWWRSCITNEKVSCWFFTDKLESIDNSETRKRILLERHKHHDIIFSPVGRGIQFGFRFLHLIQWGKANYDFRYIMRIDDDIMLCLDHLLWDLPSFPLQRVHYGWMHCQGQNLVYIDEGVSMFSKDVVEKFLSQNSDQIMCHPFGDQQVAVWEQTLRMSPAVYYMPDNKRIHHHPPASYDNNMQQKRDLCDNYIAIHGVYKNDMLQFWKRRGKGIYRKYSRKSTGNFCPYYPNVNINLFGGMYHHEPRPCSSKPHWNLDIYKKYPGRER